ncbi:MAG: dockerin type I repeat-containing protein [Lachnospiraceae bacterium]
MESAKLMAEVDNSYLAEVTDVKIQSDGSFEVTVRAKTQGTTKIRLYVEDTDLESTVVLEIRKAKAEEKPLTGDVNGDGITNASDALLILQHAAKLAQLTGKQEAAADLNADGVISAADALIVLQIAAQLI